jgi:hypothetical protein
VWHKRKEKEKKKENRRRVFEEGTKRIEMEMK